MQVEDAIRKVFFFFYVKVFNVSINVLVLLCEFLF